MYGWICCLENISFILTFLPSVILIFLASFFYSFIISLFTLHLLPTFQQTTFTFSLFFSPSFSLSLFIPFSLYFFHSLYFLSSFCLLVIFLFSLYFSYHLLHFHLLFNMNLAWPSCLGKVEIDQVKILKKLFIGKNIIY